MIRTRFMLIFVLLPFLAACTSIGGISPVTKPKLTKAGADNSQPRYATYDCGKGRKLVLENMQTSVIVIPPDGKSVELLASPADSRTRYSLEQDTLVLDKRTAFWFRTGKVPLDCKR